MRNRQRWGRTLLMLMAAFAGGAVAAQAGHATTKSASPYAPLDQMARVLVLLENNYVDPVERRKVLEGAIKGMVAELDPHSSFMTPEEFTAFNEDTEGSFGGIGVEVDFKNEYLTILAVMPDTPAAKAGMQPGDRIVAVDGKPLRGLPVDKVVRLMRGPAQTKVRMTALREGRADPVHFEMVREHIRVKSVENKRLVGEVGYLRVRQFQYGTHEELLRAAGELRRASPEPLGGVIIDMRNNPGGLIDEAEYMADEFLTSGAIYSTRHRQRIVEEVRAHWGGALAKLPTVVLVNEYSASSAELVAGALQDHGRAIIVGAPTFGKGSVQTIFQLPGGAGLRLTTMRYYTPKGHAIQVAGIQPDVVIEYSDADGAAAAVLREDRLDGHLPGEGRADRPRSTTTLQGGAHPKYTPISKLPVDPAKGADFAVQVAHRMLRKVIERNR